MRKKALKNPLIPLPAHRPMSPRHKGLKQRLKSLQKRMANTQAALFIFLFKPRMKMKRKENLMRVPALFPKPWVGGLPPPPLMQ